MPGLEPREKAHSDVAQRHANLIILFARLRKVVLDPARRLLQCPVAIVCDVRGQREANSARAVTRPPAFLEVAPQQATQRDAAAHTYQMA
jgi:hypothetical protein